MKKSFTLIELLIVIIIIGVLATLAIPQYAKMVEKSKNPEALANLNLIQDVEWAYRTETGNWAYGSGWTTTHIYLEPTDSEVISLMNKLGIENPNLNSGRKWRYWFSWVNHANPDKKPNSIAFHGYGIADPNHGLALEQAPDGERRIFETFTGGVDWKRIQ